jgi:predicted short-subunit dehydrogenase-like oxidoreductase (DUF2520 family)
VHDIAVIGLGNLGGALALGLHNAGFSLKEFVVRDRRVASLLRKRYLPDVKIIPFKTLSKISSDVVIIATEDPEITTVVSRIVPIIRPHQFVFHTSGSQSSAVLGPLRERGAYVGSLHPLTSVSDPIDGATQFRGTYFCLEGNTEAVKVAESVVRKLGGLYFTIDPAFKPLYHAAAVMAAGHFTALFDAAIEMMSLSGIGSHEPGKVLLPLMESAASNLKLRTPELALTGTFARLDIETFNRHLKAFRGVVPDDIVKLYLDLGDRSLRLVERRDGTSDKLEEFRKAILMARRKLR